MFTRLNLICHFIIGLHLFSCVNSSSPKKYSKEQKTTYKKILMIGNSFTFYWNLPHVLERMFAAKDIRIKVDQNTIGGSKLSDHWKSYLNKGYRIENYDYVVLNDYSTNAIQQIDSSAKYIKLFTSLIHKMNAKPLIYGTWEYPSLKQISILSNYNTMDRLDSLANINSAIYIPVGNAFDYIEKNHPEFNLYMEDKKHPSANATYLIACIFFSMITGETPLGLPVRFEGKNIDGKKIYYLIIDKKAAIISQNVANIITLPIRK